MISSFRERHHQCFSKRSRYAPPYFGSIRSPILSNHRLFQPHSSAVLCDLGLRRILLLPPPPVVVLDYFPDHIVWTTFRFLKNATYIFSNDSKKEEVYSREGCYGQDQCRETLR